MMTIGQMLYLWLTKLEWFSTLFPRIPVPIQKQIETKINNYCRQHNVNFSNQSACSTHEPEKRNERRERSVERKRDGGGGSREWRNDDRYDSRRNDDRNDSRRERERERDRDREREYRHK